MPKSKLVVRFSVELTEQVSFMLEIDADKFLSCDVEQLALDKARRMQDLGYFEGLNLDDEMAVFGKIKFMSKVWIN